MAFGGKAMKSGPTWRLDVHDDLPAVESALVDAGLDAHNEAAAPLHQVRPLSAFARPADGPDGARVIGDVIGGVIGRTWGALAEIQQLWVDPAQRRQGIGAGLVRAFEARARQRGCRAFHLETFSFQAPAFYQRLGCAVELERHGYPQGIVKSHLAAGEANGTEHQPGQETLAHPHQLDGLQPVLPVADVAASARWFEQVLGFQIEFLMGDPPAHGRVRSGDGTHGAPIHIHLARAPECPILPCGELRLHVGRALDAFCQACVERGAELVLAPAKQPWGLREFVLREPNGHRLRFCAEAP